MDEELKNIIVSKFKNLSFNAQLNLKDKIKNYIEFITPIQCKNLKCAYHCCGHKISYPDRCTKLQDITKCEKVIL